MYVAVDDTDSKNWMCTTFLANELIRELDPFDLIGRPRLVRLNPAVPWKTRGNGAICLRFGKGGGAQKVVGEADGKKIVAREICREPADKNTVLRVANELLSKWARVSEGASPGVVVSERKPPQRLYWSAVRRIISIEEVLRSLEGAGATYDGLSGSRGVIGAAAAMSWRPMDRTFELLAYRKRGRWGTGRDLDERSVISMDSTFSTTFNNYDHQGGKMAVAPSSPCPVLYGIRGDDPEELSKAMGGLVSEKKASYLVFLTNQATDDHIVRNWRELAPNSSYLIEGKVSREPRIFEGGHVVLAVTSRGHKVNAMAYEPSKDFRKVVRSLAVGDTIRVMGEMRESPRTLNIEKLEVINLVPIYRKLSNPRCPSCGRAMKSVGKNQGYRCRECGTRRPESSAPREEVRRAIEPGWYQPPVLARRHLSMPLERRSIQRSLRSRSKSDTDNFL